MKYEIRIRPVIRYMVSEYQSPDPEAPIGGGSRSLGEFSNFTQAREIADLVAAAKGADVISEDSSDYGDIETVGNLIAILGMYDPERTPISIEPPFTGVRVIPQESGQVLIAAARRKRDAKSV